MGQFAGFEYVDGCLYGRRGDDLFMKSITARVQNLHANFCPFRLHGTGNHAMEGKPFFICECRRMLGHASDFIGGNTAGDNHGDTASGALGVHGSQSLCAIWLLFQTGMHGSHNGTVFKDGKTQVQRRKQVWIKGVGHRVSLGWGLCQASGSSKV